MKQRIEQLDWHKVTGQMHDNGYAVLDNVLTPDECNSLTGQYDDKSLYRKTIVMERYRFGLGEYKYFNYPLPPVIEQVRQNIYPHLAPIANKWMEVLGIDKHFPVTLPELLEQCHVIGQTRPTP